MSSSVSNDNTSLVYIYQTKERWVVRKMYPNIQVIKKNKKIKKIIGGPSQISKEL